MAKRKQLSEAQEDELLNDLISNASLERGESLNTSDFKFDPGTGDDDWDDDKPKRNKITAFRLSQEQHRIWKEWCVRHKLSQSDAFLEAFKVLRNKLGA
jgi:hypothetical protein